MIKSILTHVVKFFFVVFLASPFCNFPNSAFAQEDINREPTIQAGFLLKISEFVRWPEYYSSLGTEEPLNICLRESKFGDIFDYVNDHDILRREILVRHSPPNLELKSCHFVFLSALEIKKIDNLFNEIKNSPILVVTNNEKLSHPLVAINFLRVNNMVRFEINLAAFERSGIIVSSELLSLAINVVRVD